MTTQRTLTVVLTALMLSGVMTACKSKKKAAEAAKEVPPTGEVRIKEYCTGPEFQSNDQYFRASAIGESMDQETARKKAMSNARAQLAASINTHVKAVVDNYVNSREMQNREEVGERYEALAREVIDERLSGTKEICREPVQVAATGNYKYYVCIELSGQELLSKYNERLSGDERLRIDYDYEKFKETFDAEMKKMGNR